MKNINSNVQQKISDIVVELCYFRPLFIRQNRSSKGGRHTELDIGIPEQMQYRLKKNHITIQIDDILIDAVDNGFCPPDVFRVVIQGALRKNGFYDEDFKPTLKADIIQ